MSEEGYDDGSWNPYDWRNESWNESYQTDDQSYDDSYWADDNVYYMDEYGYFQKKGKGKGKFKKGKKGKDDQRKGKPGDGKGKSNYVQPIAPTPANQPSQPSSSSTAQQAFLVLPGADPAFVTPENVSADRRREQDVEVKTKEMQGQRRIQRMLPHHILPLDTLRSQRNQIHVMSLQVNTLWRHRYHQMILMHLHFMLPNQIRRVRKVLHFMLRTRLHQQSAFWTAVALEPWAHAELLMSFVGSWMHNLTVVCGMNLSQQVQDSSLQILNNPSVLRSLLCPCIIMLGAFRAQSSTLSRKVMSHC